MFKSIEVMRNFGTVSDPETGRSAEVKVRKPGDIPRLLVEAGLTAGGIGMVIGILCKRFYYRGAREFAAAEYNALKDIGAVTEIEDV